MRFRLIVILLVTLFANDTYAKMFGQQLCKTEGYHCTRVKRGQSWTSLWPDSHERDIVMRVNRMNTQLWPGIILAVPNDLTNQSNILDYSPFPKRIDPPNEKLILVNTETVAWAAYDVDGTLVRWGPISAGADYCKDIEEPCYTHSGNFRIFSLGSSDCISRKFPLPDGGAPMPYCMYFNNGQALHGEPNGLPGYNASHGCVRLYVNDAEWLRYSFVEGPNFSNDYRGTRIEVEPEEKESDDYDPYQEDREDRENDYY